MIASTPAAPFPIDAVRAQFPALRYDRVYFDAPGGTQVCAPAIRAMVAHLERGTANTGGAFVTSAETDALATLAHAAMAELLGGKPDEIAFGANMTSLTMGVGRALSRDWQAGDELVVTRLDHDANVAPWLLVARDRGMTVRWLDFDPATGAWDPGDLAALVGPRTRLVALGGASNALGTLNDVAGAVRVVRAHAPDALVYVDAVQSAPHVAIDVAALDCDLLAFSPYKLFGPHLGVLWVRGALAATIDAYKVRPAGDEGAHRFETGTPSFEAMAAAIGMVDYLEWLGRELSPGVADRRAALIAAMDGCIAYEHELGERLLAGLREVPGLVLYGAPTMAGRVPTFGFTLAGHHPDAVATHLAARGIHAWSGHFYAVEVIRRLGLEDAGGLVRVGLCHYATLGEVDRLVTALREL